MKAREEPCASGDRASDAETQERARVDRTVEPPSNPPPDLTVRRNVSVLSLPPVRVLVTVDTRSLLKLEATATAFRLLVTVGAGLLALAILAGVTQVTAVTSAVFLLIIAAAGPLVHGWLAFVIRDEEPWMLEAILIATGALFLLDGLTTLIVYLQDVLAEQAWTYIVTFVVVAIFHIVALVLAGRDYAEKRAREETEPESEPEGEPEPS